ncbi:MAG: hypothetical protein QOE90_177 [Thermoplasmata archaeon]|jgi:hypothetical protein|nr:hypothetical protein [Thermoplasmata archaeon]
MLFAAPSDTMKLAMISAICLVTGLALVALPGASAGVVCINGSTCIDVQHVGGYCTGPASVECTGYGPGDCGYEGTCNYHLCAVYLSTGVWTCLL